MRYLAAIEQAPKGDSDEDLPLKSAALGASCVVDYLKRATDDHGNKLPRDLVVGIPLVLMVMRGLLTLYPTLIDPQYVAHSRSRFHHNICSPFMAHLFVSQHIQNYNQCTRTRHSELTP